MTSTVYVRARANGWPRQVPAGGRGLIGIARIDRQQLLVDAERVVQHAEAVADVGEDVLAREVVVVAAADRAEVAEHGAGEPTHGREVKQVPVESRDIVVAELQAADGVGPPEQHAGKVAAEPGQPAGIGQLHGKPDVAERGADVGVEREHVTGCHLEEAERLGADARLRQSFAVLERRQRVGDPEARANRVPGVEEKVARVVGER